MRWACVVVVLVLGAAACGDDDGGGPDGSVDSGFDSGDAGCVGSDCCTDSAMCDDGLHCNGVETCVASRCTAGQPIVCDDDIACTADRCDETAKACVNDAPDEDADGHPSAACLDANDEPLGDDCDDNDAQRYPGNVEICDAIDQDCNPLTFGDKDNDGDGSIDDQCSNTDDSGVVRRGFDCDDEDIARHRRQPEFCDQKDNDCDLEVDEDPGVVQWYADVDEDGVGKLPVVEETCELRPLLSLRSTDCDDNDPSARPGFPEFCDGVDNNCNGVIDERLLNCATTEVEMTVAIDECQNGQDNCDANATCQDLVQGFQCTCNDGFMGDGESCTDVDECATNNGGCDALASCTNNAGAVATCGMCPAGYAGTGATTCEPTVTGLALSTGALSPALSDSVTEYTTSLSVQAQTLTLTPTVPSGATLTINGEAAVSGVAWESPVLNLGPNTISIVVSQVGHPSRSYTFTVMRGLHQEAYVKASNAEAGDRLGGTMALSADGNTLAVGAAGEDSSATGIDGNQADNSATDSGAVYVFTRVGSVWTQQAYVKASNTDASDAFGSALALSADGNTLAIGAAGEDSNATGIDGNQADNSISSGAVYVFTRAGSVWTQQAYVKASNTGGDRFGYSVAVSADGNTLAVGALDESSSATGVGGDQTNNNAGSSGAAYVFTRVANVWSQQAYVKASNTFPNDHFGWAVALSGDGNTLGVGAIHEDRASSGINGSQAGNGKYDSGAVYVLTRSGTQWSQQAYVKASTTDAFDFFGFSLAFSDDGNTLAVSAPLEDSSSTGINGDEINNAAGESGAVFVFTRVAGTWTQQAYVKASNTDSGDRFGYSVALSADGNSLAVVAIQEDSNATGINGDQADNSATDCGAAYLFTRASGVWTQNNYVKASNTDAHDGLGYSVALSADGNTLAVDGFYEDSNATGINGDQADNSATDSGAVYVFR